MAKQQTNVRLGADTKERLKLLVVNWSMKAGYYISQADIIESLVKLHFEELGMKLPEDT